MSENRIEGYFKIDRVLFSANDSNFKIISVKPVDIEQGYELITLSEYGNFVIKGDAPTLDIGDEYKIMLDKGEKHPKFGDQYQIIYIGKPVELVDEQSQKAFLRSFLTDSQLESLYETLDDPFAAIENKDIKALMQCKGIGSKRASGIIQKYEESIDYSHTYVELFEYGLSNRMIQKLVETYASPEVVVEKVKENPYILATEVDGIGFKKADEIALKSGVKELSARRIGAFMESFLKEQSQLGMSWMTPNVLFGNAVTILGLDVGEQKVVDALREGLYDLKSRGVVWYDDSKTRIGLSKVRGIEKNIAKHLTRLKNAPNNFDYSGWEEVIKQGEATQGWEYTEQQWAGIKTALEENVVMITGYGGCVDKDTEYFNGSEWKPISQYQQGEKVLQYTTDRKAELVAPIRYVKLPETHFSVLTTPNNKINQRLSWEHNVVYEDDNSDLQKKPFYEIAKEHRYSTNGFTGKFLTTFGYDGAGIELTSQEIELIILLMNMDTKVINGKYIARPKTPEQHDRVIELLQELNIGLENEYNSHIEEPKVLEFYPNFGTDDFPRYLYKGNKKQLEVMFDSIFKWVNKGNESELIAQDREAADFIQFILATQEIQATITPLNTSYRVSYGKSNKFTIEGIGDIQTTESVDGMKYCFEVESNMLVLRREGNIFITGNTGKTSIVTGMLDVLRGYTFKQGALSGKAGARLAEVTGEDGYTIHRMLEFTPSDGFVRNEHNPLDEDIIIIDELSMVGAELFEKLVKAIKTGSKLIVLSDVGQLESIGMGNVAQDIIQSGVIPVVNLTQIHRQAQKSAITSTSLKVRKGEQFAHDVGVTILGELQDLELDIADTKDTTYDRVIHHFKKEFEKAGRRVSDVQVVVPMRKRGDISTLNLNKRLQDICNPNMSAFFSGSGEEIEIKISPDYSYTLREGDKVINTKNNYNTVDEDGEDCPVYNGDTGIIQEIDKELRMVTIDFIRVGTVLIPFDSLRNIELAYALTGHKLQGSEIDRVVVGLDYTAYMLLSREWVYTAITRAKKHCVLVAERGALRKAVDTSNVLVKQTFLQEFLKEYNPVV